VIAPFGAGIGIPWRKAGSRRSFSVETTPENLVWPDRLHLDDQSSQPMLGASEHADIAGSC
jgi:hypothetical protein